MTPQSRARVVPVVAVVSIAALALAGLFWLRAPSSSGAAPMAPAAVSTAADAGVEPADVEAAPALLPATDVVGSRDPQLDRSAASAVHWADGGVPFVNVERELRLETYDGPDGLSPGARCELRVLPVRARFYNCLVRVRCGSHVLYPNEDQRSGFLNCGTEGDRPVRASDERPSDIDGDPVIHFDITRGRVVVFDAGASSYRAELSLVDA